ncbi:hypothetical protein [Pyrococcus abyssi]|uniref:Uncharacterized protein n=1 Tax=Pyrococcus abyssi (strain GE5 / Orsay) TaxID=272844 RepID=Q9UZM1_PYRAB|nr:hypothetical protein [Pyrococcus abyssi]CAB50036.1 Hypothetical protein PAB1623 [Pyrococcus abyssi GE5]CCE70538.1 TPA: hypothetical protein PAB1623 [Pyrococcus abyssi GE5]
MLFRGKYLVKVLEINEPCKELVRGSYVVLGEDEYEIYLKIEPFMEFRREFCLVKCEGKILLSEDCKYVGEVYWVRDAIGLWRLIHGKYSESGIHLILAFVVLGILYSLLGFVKRESFWTVTGVLLVIFLVMMDLAKAIQYFLIGYVRAS